MVPIEGTMWLKDLKVLGPMGAITAIAALLVMVVTGILPTPLMSGIVSITHLQAQQDDDSMNQAEILRVGQQSCSFLAKMANESNTKCFTK